MKMTRVIKEIKIVTYFKFNALLKVPLQHNYITVSLPSCNSQMVFRNTNVNVLKATQSCLPFSLRHIRYLNQDNRHLHPVPHITLKMDQITLNTIFNRGILGD